MDKGGSTWTRRRGAVYNPEEMAAVGKGAPPSAYIASHAFEILDHHLQVLAQPRGRLGGALLRVGIGYATRSAAARHAGASCVMVRRCSFLL